jgi:outer membrane protein assembly factor BamB
MTKADILSPRVSPSFSPGAFVVQLRRSTWSGFRMVPLLLAGLAAVNGCTPEPVASKPHPIEVLPARSFTRAWAGPSHSAGDPIRVIDVRDDLVYVYFDSKQVYGVERKSGKFRFSISVYSPTHELRPLVELKDKVVFPNATTLEVYDFDGDHERTVHLNKSLVSNAAGSGENIYFGSTGPNGGLVEAYDMSDDPATVAAPFKWEYLANEGGEILAAPATLQGIVYSGSTHGEVDAVNEKAIPVWDTDRQMFLVGEQLTVDRAPMTDNKISADLRVDESGLYVASKNGTMFCINRATGKLLWQYFAGAPLGESPILAADTVYINVRNKGVVALDKGNKFAFNRTPRWTYPTATQFLSQDAKYTYLAEPTTKSDDGTQMYHIIAVDKATGVKAFASDRDDFTAFGSNKRDAMIYVGFADGSFMAVTPVLKPGQIGELVMGPVGEDAIAAVR